MEETLLIATSIAPNDRLSVQKESVLSWLNAGMEVISLNTDEEIEKLAPSFRNVDFIPQIRTGKSFFGKPYIFISEILNHLKTTQHTICGIINSDIALIENSNLSPFLIDQAQGSLVYGPRFQVNSFESNEGSIDPLGFDYFIFDQSLIPDWNETHFCLGLPSWDHWFPLVPILIGRPIKKLISPIARHIPHDIPIDRDVIPFNNEFISQIINRFALTENNLSNLISPENAILFNKFNFVKKYETLVTKIQNSEHASAEIKLSHYEKLALFFDEFTRHSIHFLDKNSEKIEFEI
jgi:hypothetical protein